MSVMGGKRTFGRYDAFNLFSENDMSWFRRSKSTASAVTAPDAVAVQSPSEIVIELAKTLISFAERTAGSWSKVYYRFACAPGQTKSSASYVGPDRVELISALGNKDFLDEMGALSGKLFSVLNESQGVLLLEAATDFSYNVHYDFEDLGRWQITKLNGATGIPAGLD